MKKFIRKWAAPILCGLFVFILFKFIFFVGYVPSESMEPTIKAGSLIIGNRLVSEIRHGDILVFDHNGYMLVKRVAAISGDIIYIDETGTSISINEIMPDAIRIFMVPDNCYFMLGDNAEGSIDSRVWETPFVEHTQVIAKLWKH